MARIPYHLALRDDEPFEALLYECAKTLPYGASKRFLLNAAALVIGRERDPKAVARIMYQFADLPRADVSADEPVIPRFRGNAKAAARLFPRSVNEGIARSGVDTWAGRRPPKAVVSRATVVRLRRAAAKAPAAEATPPPAAKQAELPLLEGGMFS